MVVNVHLLIIGCLVNTQTLTIKYFDFLERRGKTFNIAVGLLCTALLGFLDYYSDFITGVDYTLAFFYLLPVSFVAWFAGKKAGIAISLICVLTKMSVQLASEELLALVIWKNGTSLAFFLVITVLVAKIRQLLEHERTLSRTDHLTGAVNARAFLEALKNEIYRQGRNYHPFGLAYIDIDNFKEINDIFGHKAGDIVLKTVVETISENLRRTDLIARLGGDEFAILLPDTNEAAGETAVEKIREQLHISMRQYNLTVTFSIGLLTCTEPPESADEVITIADNLMYDVKKNGKNSVRHAAYARKHQEPGREAA
jgi:diguanylate cyclase (GGDEF)-like protein